jgi:type I restriction enzyme S subunit
MHAAVQRQTHLPSAWIIENVENRGVEVSLADVVTDTRTGWDRRRGLTVEQPDGHPYLKMNQIDFDGRLNLSGLTHVQGSLEEAERYRVRTGDVLFNNRNSRELVGKTAIVDNRANGYTYNNNLVRLRFNTSVIPAFAVMQMNATPFRRRVASNVSASTNVAAIYTRDLLRQVLWVPDLERQAALVASYDNVAVGLKRMTSTLSDLGERSVRLRRSLLKAAFTGRLLGRGSDLDLVKEMPGV